MDKHNIKPKIKQEITGIIIIIIIILIIIIITMITMATYYVSKSATTREFRDDCVRLVPTTPHGTGTKVVPFDLM
jgi:flagellar basal body-associated protein FliL